MTLRARPARGRQGVHQRRVRVGTLAAGKTRTVKLKLRTKRRSSRGADRQEREGAHHREGPRSSCAVRVNEPAEGRPRRPATSHSATADPMGPGRREAYRVRRRPLGVSRDPEGRPAGVHPPPDRPASARGRRPPRPTAACPTATEAKAGILEIDGARASLSPDGAELKLGDDSYWLTPIVKPGTGPPSRSRASYVSGYWPNQFVTTYWLEMTADGGFMLSRQTLGSSGTPWARPAQATSRASPRTSTAPTPSCPAASSGSRSPTARSRTARSASTATRRRAAPIPPRTASGSTTTRSGRTTRTSGSARVAAHEALDPDPVAPGLGRPVVGALDPQAVLNPITPLNTVWMYPPCQSVEVPLAHEVAVAPAGRRPRTARCPRRRRRARRSPTSPRVPSRHRPSRAACRRSGGTRPCARTSSRRAAPCGRGRGDGEEDERGGGEQARHGGQP